MTDPDQAALHADIVTIRAVFAYDTSELPDLWTLDLPSTGHCHVVALLLHARWGGRILRGPVVHRDGSTVHYVNLIGRYWVDPTTVQFIDPVYDTSVFTDATLEVLNQATVGKWVRFTRRFDAVVCEHRGAA